MLVAGVWEATITTALLGTNAVLPFGQGACQRVADVRFTSTAVCECDAVRISLRLTAHSTLEQRVALVPGHSESGVTDRSTACFVFSSHEDTELADITIATYGTTLGFAFLGIDYIIDDARTPAILIRDRMHCFGLVNP